MTFGLLKKTSQIIDSYKPEVLPAFVATGKGSEGHAWPLLLL